ncbi:MAG: N-6 DNA methylase, partial [Vulcanimicrobiaceae bacterium]
TGAVTRGSGSRNEDRERNIRKWFVDRDLIEGVILLPPNLFYNTSAPGVIVVLNRKKESDRRGKIVFLNASDRFEKGRPKNNIPEAVIRPIAASFLNGASVDGFAAIVSNEIIAAADYHLSPSKWVTAVGEHTPIDIVNTVQQLVDLSDQITAADHTVLALIAPLIDLVGDRR